VAPVTTVVLAGIHTEDAGSASGVLATMQEVAGAAGVALIGVVFFGLLGTNANHATNEVVPGLRAGLIANGAPAQQADGVVSGFRTCFKDRAASDDPSDVPASCKQGDQATGGPNDGALIDKAVKNATQIDFSRTMQLTLLFEVGAFLLALVAGLALPKVDPKRLEQMTLEGH
jgi:hypothetical protein